MSGPLVRPEPQPDRTVLLRGTGLLRVLGQFIAWGILPDQNGVIIPADRLPNAIAALTAAGYTVLGAASTPTPPAPGTKLDAPECARCGSNVARRLRDRIGEVGEACQHCGQPLVIVRHLRDVPDTMREQRCPDCRRALTAGMPYCACGRPNDPPPSTKIDVQRLLTDAVHAHRLPTEHDPPAPAAVDREATLRKLAAQRSAEHRHEHPDTRPAPEKTR